MSQDIDAFCWQGPRRRESIKIRLFLVGLLVLVDLEVSQRVGVLVGGNDSQEVLEERISQGFWRGRSLDLPRAGSS